MTLWCHDNDKSGYDYDGPLTFYLPLMMFEKWFGNVFALPCDNMLQFRNAWVAE